MEIDRCNTSGGNELSEPITILRTKFSTLDKTECYFFQAGMTINYYCTLEFDNGHKSLYGKRVCRDAFFYVGIGGIYCNRSLLSVLIALIAKKYQPRILIKMQKLQIMWRLRLLIFWKQLSRR